ncbi:MAG: hypothetical protein ACT4OX_08830 [Actinomycetota bacterium]
MRDTPRVWWEDPIRWLTGFVFALVGGITIIGNHAHAVGNDATFSQMLVNRALRFGGSYYENGIHPKGPLEEVAHDIARRIGGYNGHWYVISAMIAISALVLGYAAARTAMATGGNGYVGLAVGAAVFVHFTLSDAPYAGLFYARNILVAMLALAWIIVLEGRLWSTPRGLWIAALTTGLILGLAVQTILPALFDAAAIGIGALLLLRDRVENPARQRRLRDLIVVSGAVGVASAPLWYLARGSFEEFWASWWTYALYQNVGIGLSTGEQLARGWDNAYAYYQERPVLFLLLAAFVVSTVSMWSQLDRRTRIVHGVVLAWFLAGWFQMVVGLRYSTHYYAVVAAPTAMIGGALAGHAGRVLMNRPRPTRAILGAPLAAVLLTIYLSSGTASRVVNASEITGAFTSIDRGVELGRNSRPGPDKSVQALLDLVSRDEDALLVWDDNQFIYPTYRRVPATRFHQKYFVLGAIYLGRTGPEYVLDHTWEWFADDIRESDPAAFLETDPVEAGRFKVLVDDNFTPVFTGTNDTVHLRNELAAAVVDGAASDQWELEGPPLAETGWDAGAGAARFEQDALAPVDDRLPFASDSCRRIEGRVDTHEPGSAGVVFHFFDDAGALDAAGRRPESVRIVLDGATAASKDVNDGVIEQLPTGREGDDAIPFALVMGKRAAVLVVGGRVVAAVRLPADTSVTVEPMRPALEFLRLAVGPPPPGSGC